MTTVSALQNIYKKGLFGDYEKKNDNELIKIYEKKNLQIIQLFQYKNSTLTINDVKIDELSLSKESLRVNNNNNTRILWCGPNHWLIVSLKKELLKSINLSLNETDFSITDLSSSRAIMQLEGENSREVLKKGCPFNIDELKKNQCVNSTFNGITITIDMINENPDKIRLFSLRSFGESLYHSITDSSLEFGYKTL